VSSVLSPTNPPSAAPPKAILHVENLACERDERCLYHGLTLSVQRGELWHIKGNNGAGKTTFLKQLAGLHSIDEGDVTYASDTTKVIYIGHKLGLKDQLTANENLSWLVSLSGSSTQAQRYDALEKVGLRGYEENLVAHLSAGQKRRVAFARLHLQYADLWLLDEPFTSLDQQGIADEQSWLRQHLDMGGSVLMTSHQEVTVDGVKMLDLGNYALANDLFKRGC